MIKIYMLQTLKLIALTDEDFANEIIANSTAVKMKDESIYFILNDNYPN